MFLLPITSVGSGDNPAKLADSFGRSQTMDLGDDPVLWIGFGIAFIAFSVSLIVGIRLFRKSKKSKGLVCSVLSFSLFLCTAWVGVEILRDGSLDAMENDTQWLADQEIIDELDGLDFEIEY